MSKGAVGLVAGYWPEDVYRYLATPAVPLDEGLVARAVKRRATAPAILTTSEVLTYQALATAVDGAMGAVLALLGDGGSRVALAVRDPLDSLKIFLGALKGRCTVLLADPAAPAEALRGLALGFQPDLVVADEAIAGRLGAAALEPAARRATVDEVWRLGAARPKAKLKLGLRAPAVAMAGEDGALVYHSHNSLLSGALSWSTFLALREDAVLLALRPLHTWEGLYSVLPALFRGGACVLADAEGADGLVSLLRQHRPAYALLPIADAFRLAADRDVAREIAAALHGVFVSVAGPFWAAARRKLGTLLGRPVLTVYGRAESGPVLASHPAWHLDEAVGIPVTNVDVWPLNPATGNPLPVPWEAIEHGEIGVKSPMAAVGYRTPDEMQERVREGWLRTRLVASMDPSGLFYLLSTVK